MAALRRCHLAAICALLFVCALLGFGICETLRLRRALYAGTPESATGRRNVAEVRTRHSIVVAAHPEAVRRGRAVLLRGGSAIDAAAAVQATLNLVEPQSSGIGGGAFVLYFDAQRGTLTAYDGRETAPAAATPELFLDENGEPKRVPEALLGGLAVGVPGVVRLLALLHERHGKLPWATLFEDAAQLADTGFAVSPRLHELVAFDPILPALPTLRGYFFGQDDKALPVGTMLRNPPLAATLRLIARDGADAFYSGPVAQEIALAVQNGRRPTLARMGFNLVARRMGVATTGSATEPASGRLTVADLAAYRPIERAPICVPYRRFRVCGFPPPSSGGVAILQALRLLERFDLSRFSPNSASALHLLIEAERLAYADRATWIADADFVPVPTTGLLDEGYLGARGAAIREDRAMTSVAAGNPPGATRDFAPATSFDVPSTTHFVIVDAQGNVACATSSIEFAFGAHVMVRGFLLNNQLTDFSFVAQRDGKPVANAVAPRKRPRSTMSPLLVFDGATGRPILALGSAGGSRIVGYVLRALIGVLDFGLSPQQAVALPHVLDTGAGTELEDGGWTSDAERDALQRELSARGHAVTTRPENSGLHAVALSPDGLVAGIDPRREGAAAGD